MPLTQVLRLLSLYSLCSDGLKTKQYDFYRREITQTYGHSHILTLQNLAKAGLFKRQESGMQLGRAGYSSVRKSLNLIVDDVDELNPNDISYVYSGFAPISVRLVQICLSKSVNLASKPDVAIGWKGWEDPLRVSYF